MIALIASLFAFQATAAAETAQVVRGPSVSGVDVFLAAPAADLHGVPMGSFLLTVGGTTYNAFCLAAPKAVPFGDFDVDIVTPADTAGTRGLAKALADFQGGIAETASGRVEAAALQVAAWRLYDASQVNDPTTNRGDINTRAAQILTAATGGSPTVAPLTIAPAAPTAAPGATVTLTINGPANAVVTLSSTGGTLGASQVTLNGSGTGSTTITSAAAGVATVTGVTAGTPSLRIATPTRDSLQPFAFLVPTTQQATASVSFATPPAPPIPPTTPPLTVTPPTVKPAATPTPSPRLQIVKTGPATAKAGQLVRYTIRVRNISDVTATNVRLSDRIPGGLSLSRSDRQSTLRGGVLEWKLGALTRGSTIVVHLWMRADSGIVGARRNLATASADRVKPISDDAVTTFARVLNRRQPPVTG